VLERPVCIIAWRHPMAVARSLETRDRKATLVSLAIWEHYLRTLLRDSAGLPRVLVSYEALLAEPERVTRELHQSLSGLGVQGLTMPSSERLRQVVNADFNRSGRSAVLDERLLDGGQHELLAALSSGAALEMPIEPTPAHTLELLAGFQRMDEMQKALAKDIAERDELIQAIFESRSWRLGHRLTGILRRGGVTAMDRWKAMRSRT
jgi:hypothetical protein